jgi:hypothetical protein
MEATANILQTWQNNHLLEWNMNATNSLDDNMLVAIPITKFTSMVDENLQSYCLQSLL